MEPSNTPSTSTAHPPRSLWRKVRAILYPTLAVLAAWLFLMVIMAAAAGWYTSRPVFCNSCHIMEPYYKSWQQSSHKDVTCVECHFPPGVGGKLRGKMLGLVQLLKYVTASAGTRPSAEIPDASCLRSGCHETRLLSGKVDFHGIPFDHTPHLQEGRRGKTLRCTSCHSQIVQGKHMTVTTTTCFLCHFKDQPFNEKLSACTHCHQIPQREFDLGGGVKFTHELAFKKGVDCKSCHGDLIRGKGEVPRERCLSCHNREGDLEHIQDHEFMHKKHVTDHKVDCIQCHSPILHTLDLKKLEHASSDCQSCHPNHHQEQVNLLQGRGARLLEEPGTKAGAPDPNLMIGIRVECRTCHTVRETSSTGTELVRGSKAMCSVCHDAATVKQFEAYHISLRSALPLLQATMTKVETVAKQPGDHPAKLIEEIAKLRHDLDLLTKGNDIHNMHYATKVVREVTQRLADVCRQLKIEEPKVSLPAPVQQKPTSTRVEATKAVPEKQGSK
ncbi:MAG: NapC/NirT family cytochrome c [Planctomycetota bacterium]